MTEQPASHQARPEEHHGRKVFWFLLTASLGALTLSLYVADTALLLSVPTGWLLAVVAVGLSLTHLAACPNGRALARLGLLMSVLLVVAHTTVARRVERQLRYVISGQAVGGALMKGLGTALQECTGKLGAYPGSLTELVDGDQALVHSKNLVSPLDPGCDFSYSYADWPDDLMYSSYVYQPGQGPWLADPRVVLAYEHGAWQLMELRLFPEYARFVLFGDGRVELLDAMRFTAALRDDAVRRRELGWPQQMDRPWREPLVAQTHQAE